MKLSVSLAAEDVDFIDGYARTHGYGSRSAVLQRALRLLSGTELAGAYAAAWVEWDESGEADVWDATAADGLPPA